MKRSILVKIFFPFFLAILLLTQMVVPSGCANIVPPAGGPRDSLPPILVKATPPENTKNYDGTRIVLTFDEYVDLDNPQSNLIVSPIPKNQPTVTRKLNTVTIKIRDTLEPNTTYALDFGNTIKDINENNILKNFSYIFSTGNYIDSLQFSGKIMLAETGESDSTLTAMLYRSKDDSTVIKDNPRYVTKTDGKGVFTFKHLSPGTYYLYAIKDENGGNYRYSPKALFAFADSAIIIGGEAKPVTLYAYASAEKPLTGNIPSAAARKPPAGEKRLKFSTNVKVQRQDLLEKFIITFETPVKSFDSSKVHISTDTTFTPLTTPYKWTFDSTRKNLTFDYAWKENTLYNMIFEKDFATDTSGQQLLKTDTLNFTTKSNSDYGKLSIRFRNLDLSKNPVLLFVQGGTVVSSFPLTSDRFSNNMFPPGEYDLRVLSDMNKNGKWDPGEFFGKHRQPELVKPVTRKLTIKANWENSFEIAL